MGPNLILTASHCVVWHEHDYINIQTATSDKDYFKATVLYNSNFPIDTGGDYALLKVNALHSNKWFGIAPDLKNYKNARSAGFGNLRVLKDDELKIIKRAIIYVLEKELKKNLSFLNPFIIENITRIQAEIKDIELSSQNFKKELEATLALPNYNIPSIYGDYNKLKVSGPCDFSINMPFHWESSCNILISKGNSGGPLILNLLTDNPTIIGVTSGGFHTLASTIPGAISYYTKPEFFRDKINKYLFTELGPSEQISARFYNTNPYTSQQKYIIQVVKDSPFANLILSDLQGKFPDSYKNNIYIKKENGHSNVRINVKPDTMDQLIKIINYIKELKLWLININEAKCSENGDEYGDNSFILSCSELINYYETHK